MKVMGFNSGALHLTCEACEEDEEKDSDRLHGTKLGRGTLPVMTSVENLSRRVSAHWNDAALQSMEELLRGNPSIVITAHRSPDGDAVGSTLGLYHLLTAMNLRASAVLPDRFAPFLDWMPGSESITFQSEASEASENLVAEADVIFCLDYNSLDRAGLLSKSIEKSGAKKIMIDHHREPDSFVDVMVSDPTCGSTCELVCDWALASGHWGDMSIAAAQCLYTGIVTDTGSFRFPSVSSHTHGVVSALLDLGLNHSEVHESTFDDQSLSRVQLQGYAMSERLKIWKDGGVGVVALDLNDLERFNYESGDTEGLVNRILGIRGIRMAIFMKESEPGKVKMSLRSKGAVDVQALAVANFNGGGHMNAAGGVLLGLSLEEAKTKVSSVIDAWVSSKA